MLVHQKQAWGHAFITFLILHSITTSERVIQWDDVVNSDATSLLLWLAACSLAERLICHMWQTYYRSQCICGNFCRAFRILPYGNEPRDRHQILCSSRSKDARCSYWSVTACSSAQYAPQQKRWIIMERYLVSPSREPRLVTAVACSPQASSERGKIDLQSDGVLLR